MKRNCYKDAEIAGLCDVNLVLLGGPSELIDLKVNGRLSSKVAQRIIDGDIVPVQRVVVGLRFCFGLWHRLKPPIPAQILTEFRHFGDSNSYRFNCSATYYYPCTWECCSGGSIHLRKRLRLNTT